jgi:hypothetical protein
LNQVAGHSHYELQLWLAQMFQQQGLLCTKNAVHKLHQSKVAEVAAAAMLAVGHKTLWLLLSTSWQVLAAGHQRTSLGL